LKRKNARLDGDDEGSFAVTVSALTIDAGACPETIQYKTIKQAHHSGHEGQNGKSPKTKFDFST
jgi:hypothetical protein